MIRRSGNPLPLLPGLVLAAFLMPASPAHATAGVACHAEDATLSLGLGAAFGRALGAGLANFAAGLEIRSAQAPRDLRVLRFERPAQSWWHHDTLNFHLHFERQARPYGSVDFVIETTRQPDDENRYAGRYLLSLAVAPAGSDIIDPPLEFRGDVVCTAD